MLAVSNSRSDLLHQGVARAYGRVGAIGSVSPQGTREAGNARHRQTSAETVIVTIRKPEAQADEEASKAGRKRPEGAHLLFRRALASYAKACDLGCDQGLRRSQGGRVVDRAAVYHNRSYF